MKEVEAIQPHPVIDRNAKPLSFRVERKRRKNAAQGPFPPLGIPPLIGQRRGRHALRAYLYSVPTLSYPQ